MAGQVEKRLRKGTGRDLGERRDAGPPMPAANSKQGRLVAPRDRRVASGRLDVMEQLVSYEYLSRRCRPEQPRDQAACDRTIERREPAVVKQDAGRPSPIFGKPPERADQRIVIGFCHRHVKPAGNFMRREIGETRPQGLRCRGSVRERIANRGELGGVIQPPSVNVAFQHDKPERFG